ncbi:type II secretion system protein GspC [Paraliomyxa miuraensis]|uniref:type II secretion system protein GspC n=1 Tax=Paraliomyxa miuraensis TaxID=376150 RepID=UPI00224E67EF|nr:type II secretion system protein GspC [Paraliomyxa miuraensis]MCX4242947.1 hypothetical protein [Paraliomyxa miuraensis]
MEALFKKYFWVIKTLGIAVACGLAASAVTTQIGASMLFDAEADDEDEADSDGEDDGEDDGDEDGATKSKTKTSKSRGFRFDEDAFGGSSTTSKSKDKERVGERIRKHNVFCPTCAPPAEEVPVADAGLDDSGRPTGPLLSPGETKSKLPLRLVTTMEAVEPEDSLATILDTEVGVAGLFGRGDLVRKGVEVVGVEQGLVHLRNNAALEYIEIGDDAPPPPRATTPAKDDEGKDAPPKNDRAIEGAEEAINCPNENTCTVDRAFVEKLMANPALLAKQARIVAKQKDDEVVGYKLYGIRRGSLPKLLGLKNGDMITAVNGEELKSMDKAMALYTKLRRASNLSVSIERKGKTINKDIQIQ